MGVEGKVCVSETSPGVPSKTEQNSEIKNAVTLPAEDSHRSHFLYPLVHISK